MGVIQTCLFQLPWRAACAPSVCRAVVNLNALMDIFGLQEVAP